MLLSQRPNKTFASINAILVALTVAALACGDDAAPVDAAVDTLADTGGGSPCEAEDLCDDGVFCNGVELCLPADENADVNGCVRGGEPCDGSACNAETDSCEDCVRGGPDDPDDDGYCADDCAPMDGDVHPNAIEVCIPGQPSAMLDEDCDPLTIGDDVDGDGFVMRGCCNGDRCGRDCDDAASGVNPEATDGCGGGDEDCDGMIDEEPDSIYYRDEDSDTYGVDDDTVMSCSLPLGYAAVGGDCVDDPLMAGANEINPGATDICDTMDNDCSGTADDEFACSCLFEDTRDCGDFDHELGGVGQCVLGQETCTREGMWDGNCRGATGPREEICGGDDEDCDGHIDEGAPMNAQRWYRDQDSDRFGDPDMFVEACAAPAGYVGTPGDCGPESALISPAAPEICDGSVDNNCNGQSDAVECGCTNGNTRACGPASETGGCRFGVQICSGGAWGGCTGATYPRSETCNGLDDDCDGVVDEGRDDTAPPDAVLFYRDGDGDSFGDVHVTTLACAPPEGYVANDEDCDDSDSSFSPAATERTGDERDQNCDGREVCWVDEDSDGYRAILSSNTILSSDVDCDDAGEASNGTPRTDCNDRSGFIHPGAFEVVGDEVDQDCDLHEICYADVDQDGYKSANRVTSPNRNCLRSRGEARDRDPTEWPSGSRFHPECCDHDSSSHQGVSWRTGTTSGCHNGDWNCDSQSERRYTQVQTCSGWPGCGSGHPGWETSVPGCGSVGARRTTCATIGFECGAAVARSQQCR